MSKLISRIGACLAVALLLAGCGGGGSGGGSAPPPAPTFTDPVLYSTAATASLPSAVEIAAVTKHQLVIKGTTLNYTATAAGPSERRAAAGAVRRQRRVGGAQPPGADDLAASGQGRPPLRVGHDA